jgi:hypothetical protein
MPSKIRTRAPEEKTKGASWELLIVSVSGRREIVIIISRGALTLQNRFVGIIYRFGSSTRVRFHARKYR